MNGLTLLLLVIASVIAYMVGFADGRTDRQLFGDGDELRDTYD